MEVRNRVFQPFSARELVLPGLPFDYRDGEIQEPSWREMLKDPEALALLKADMCPIPIPEAREMYFGERHLEFWASGYSDYRRVVQITDFDKMKNPSLLDHGGASGRVMRHFVQANPDGEFYLSDSNPQHIRLVNYLFGGRVAGIFNDGLPTLPLPDNSIDLVTMFSVMTHVAEGDISWLLEFRRLVRRGGYVYATIHDESSWKLATNVESFLYNTLSGTPGFLEYLRNHPELTETVVQFYSEGPSNNCNVFHTRDYINSIWGRYFDIISIGSLDHAHQSSVVMRSKK